VSNDNGYWSVTGDLSCGRKRIDGGMLHDEIRKHLPRLAPFIDLHLSNTDGVPMHVLENGYYWLAGMVEGNWNQRYHGANDCTGRSTDECRRIAAKHFRTTEPAIDALVYWLNTLPISEHKSALREMIDRDFAPRWKREASDCEMLALSLTH
jgi:hypothetical protein